MMSFSFFSKTLIGFYLTLNMPIQAFAEHDRPTETVQLGARTERVIELAQSHYPNRCRFLTDEYKHTLTSDLRIFSLNVGGLEKLYEIPCDSGAYNLSKVYFLETQYKELIPVSFQVPQYEAIYTDSTENTVEYIKLTGFKTREILIGTTFDPDTNILTSFFAWRGIGDAFSSGTWLLKQDGFALRTYEVDPTYDGEQKPITLLEFND